MATNHMTAPPRSGETAEAGERMTWLTMKKDNIPYFVFGLLGVVVGLAIAFGPGGFVAGSGFVLIITSVVNYPE